MSEWAPKRVISISELEGMSPAERAAAIDASIVRDGSAVSPEFRAVVDATARRLGDEHRSRGLNAWCGCPAGTSPWCG